MVVEDATSSTQPQQEAGGGSQVKMEEVDSQTEDNIPERDALVTENNLKADPIENHVREPEQTEDSMEETMTYCTQETMADREGRTGSCSSLDESLPEQPTQSGKKNPRSRIPIPELQTPRNTPAHSRQDAMSGNEGTSRSQVSMRRRSERVERRQSLQATPIEPVIHATCSGSSACHSLAPENRPEAPGEIRKTSGPAGSHPATFASCNENRCTDSRASNNRRNAEIRDLEETRGNMELISSSTVGEGRTLRPRRNSRASTASSARESTPSTRATGIRGSQKRRLGSTMSLKVTRPVNAMMDRIREHQDRARRTMCDVRRNISRKWTEDTVKGITYETDPLGIGGQHIFFNSMCH